ncbi:hypothetical protein BH09ACT12_BH09ACT12_07470 [soil metagenome]
MTVMAGALIAVRSAPAQADLLDSEVDYACGSYDAGSGTSGGRVAAETNIVAPGRCDYLHDNDDHVDYFLRSKTLKYYAKFNFTSNFMYHAPIRSVDMQESAVSYCSEFHGPGPQNFCPAPNGNPMKNIRWGPADRLWGGKTTVKINNNSGYIFAVCGNFSNSGGGDYRPPSLAGRKFEDKNGDGVHQSSEPWIQGVKIDIFKGSTRVKTLTTDASGRYNLVLNANSDDGDPRLTPGTYRAVERVPAGYVKTTADPSVTVPPHQGTHTYRFANIGNQKQVDVQLVKESLDPVTVAGEETRWQLDIRNNGPSSAPDVVVTDTVPASYTAITSASAPCAFTGRSLRCEFGTLAAGATRRVTFRSLSKADLANNSVIVNTARVRTSMPEFDYSNNVDSADTTVHTRADVSIIKRSDHELYRAGDPFTFTLRVKNDGPSYARSVTASDLVPDVFRVTSALTAHAGDTCDVDAQLVTCDLGALQPHAERVITLGGVVRGVPPGASDSELEHGHEMDVTKVQTSWSLEARAEDVAFSVACPSGYFVSDVTWFVSAVDQGTGNPDDVYATEVVSDTDGSGRIVLSSNATVRAQGHLFAVCMTRSPAFARGHRHDLVTGPDVVSAPLVIGPGRTTVTLEVAEYEHAIAPGFTILDGDARLYGSETDDGTTWTFFFDVLPDKTATVQTQVRPLERFTTIGSSGTLRAHSHRLEFDHLKDQLDAPVGTTVRRLTCATGYKGITGTYVGVNGGDPQPISRDFTIFNPGPGLMPVTIDLVCFRLNGTNPPPEWANTADVVSATADPQPGNNSDTVWGRISASFTGSAAPGAGLVASPRFRQEGRVVRGVIACEKRCRAEVRVKVRGHRDVTRRVWVRADRRTKVGVRIPRAWKAVAVVVTAAGDRERRQVRRV